MYFADSVVAAYRCLYYVGRKEVFVAGADMMAMIRRNVLSVAAIALLLIAPVNCLADELHPIALVSQVTKVQPMTGIVLWTSNEEVETAPIQLEFSYLKYDQIVSDKGVYDWTPVDKLLAEVASRKHQAILRWHDTYVGRPNGVPKYIQSLDDYHETTAKSEGKQTGFPDWSHPELQSFVLDFFSEFARRYDRDPRLAFVQAGFGLWAEYHIYDGPMKLGHTFPSKEFQSRFARHLSREFRQTPWMLSINAAEGHAPFATDQELLALRFGSFDDSFNHAQHKKWNEVNWGRIGLDRWKTSPTGGEFSFYEPKDQQEALSPTGPHGIPFEQQAARYHVSFIIGDAQPRYQSRERLIEACLACGYRFRVTRFDASTAQAEVTIQNTGIAPIYYDAYPAVNDVRSDTSLKRLLPNDSRTFKIAAGGSAPTLSIECDRLVPGQRIEFDAELK